MNEIKDSDVVQLSEIEKILASWKASLCPQINLCGMVKRNSIAYKWLALFRILAIRECVFWRTYDLLAQAHELFKSKHILGSRILIRSAIESAGILAYINQSIDKVLTGELDFHCFSEKTKQLYFGSRNNTTKHQAINIITVLNECNKKYNGISQIYDIYSESTHPNYEGVMLGYSRFDPDQFEHNFNNWLVEMYGDKHDVSIINVAKLCHGEYYNFAQQLEKLETWVTEHNTDLEATNPDTSPQSVKSGD